MRSAILDTGPCLNFLAIDQGPLLYKVLDANHDGIMVPREVAEEIHDKASDSPKKFGAAARRFEGLSREPKFRILESPADDIKLYRAIKRVSPIPPSELMKGQRQKDRGEILVISHALKLRDEGVNVSLVMDDRGGRAIAKRFGFQPIRTTRIFATAGSMGLLNYGQAKILYEKLRASDGSRIMDTGLLHWSDSGLDNRQLYKKD